MDCTYCSGAHKFLAVLMGFCTVETTDNQLSNLITHFDIITYLISYIVYSQWPTLEVWQQCVLPHSLFKIHHLVISAYWRVFIFTILVFDVIKSVYFLLLQCSMPVKLIGCYNYLNSFWHINVANLEKVCTDWAF